MLVNEPACGPAQPILGKSAKEKKKKKMYIFLMSAGHMSFFPAWILQGFPEKNFSHLRGGPCLGFKEGSLPLGLPSLQLVCHGS